MLGVVLVNFKDVLADGQFKLLLHRLWQMETNVILERYDFRV